MNYSSEDTQQILQLAMQRKQEESFSQKQLSDMAAELGISEELLQSAKQEWLTQAKVNRQKQAHHEQLRRGFRVHLISFLAVNTFLVVLNLMTTPRDFWAIYPLSGWGLGLVMHNLKANPDRMLQSHLGCKQS